MPHILVVMFVLGLNGMGPRGFVLSHDVYCK